MTDAEIQQFAARNAVRKIAKSRTTPGPWFVNQLDDDMAQCLVAVSTVVDDGRSRRWPAFDSGTIVAATLVQQPRYVDVEDGLWESNAEFIAFARSDYVEDDVDSLIAEIRRLRSILPDG